MSKKLSILVVLCMLLTSFSGLTLVTQAALTGAGTDAEPYLINSAEDFAAISDLTAVYAVTADITEPVTVSVSGFSGKLIGYSADGKTEEMRSIQVNISGNGLFASLSGNAEIRNITLKGTVTGTTAGVGGFVGSFTSAGTVTMENCVNEATVSGGQYTGGFVGNGFSGMTKLVLKNLLNRGIVSGSSNRVGGIAGGIGTVTAVENCANLGTVSGRSTETGGIVGMNYGSVSACWNAGAVSGTKTVGGIVGNFISNSAVKMYNCYNTGSVTATASDGTAGGIVGTKAGNQPIENCYHAGTLSGTSVYPIANANPTGISRTYYLSETAADDGLDNTTPLTAAQMAVTDSFTGFDFTDTWTIDANTGYSYPQLRANPHIIDWGTDENPYIVDSAEDFDNIRKAPSAVYSLTADIELPETYEPFVFSGKLIGSDPENLKNIHVTIKKNGVNNVGLFTQIAGGVQIKNIKLTGSVIGQNNTGGFFGSASTTDKTTAGSAVENCVNDANITGYNKVGGIGGSSYGAGTLTMNHVTNTGIVNGGSGPNVGGIAGLIDIALTNAANRGSVNGGASTGGIVGWSYGNISGSYNSGSVTGTSKVGGIVGNLDKANLKIENCYNNGDITASSSDDTSGGILGYTGKTGTSVANCYSTGAVTDGGNFNPIYSNGGTTNATVSNCFYLSVNGQDDGLDGTTAKTLAEMKALAASLGGKFTAPTGEYQFPEIIDNLNTSGYKLYAVSVTAGTGGTITPSGVLYIKGGENFNGTITAADGYQIDAILLNTVTQVIQNAISYSITEDSVISVTFKVIPAEEPSITHTYTEKFTSSGPQTINGEEIAGPMSIVFAKVLDFNGYTLQDFGMEFAVDEATLTAGNGKKCSATAGKSSLGNYGICFYGNFTKGQTYYTRPYAIYVKEGEEPLIVTGQILEIVPNP